MKSGVRTSGGTPLAALQSACWLYASLDRRRPGAAASLGERLAET